MRGERCEVIAVFVDGASLKFISSYLHLLTVTPNRRKREGGVTLAWWGSLGLHDERRDVTAVVVDGFVLTFFPRSNTKQRGRGIG